MEDSPKPKMTTRQKVVGGIAAIAMAGVGTFSTGVFKAAGDGVGEVIKPIVIEAAHNQLNGNQPANQSTPPVIETGTATTQKTIQPISEKDVGTPVATSTFDEDYQDCYDKTAGNPNINTSDNMAVFEANIYCLLTEKNQGAELDKRAESDENLKAILNKIRNR